MRGLVSCTGAQFCGLALIETKNRAQAVLTKLEHELNIPAMVRIHWTGCPNSCGQAQVGDIGLMGAPAKLDGKAVEGVKIMVGGKIGENPEVREREEGVDVVLGSARRALSPLVPLINFLRRRRRRRKISPHHPTSFPHRAAGGGL